MQVYHSMSLSQKFLKYFLKQNTFLLFGEFLKTGRNYLKLCNTCYFKKSTENSLCKLI